MGDGAVKTKIRVRCAAVVIRGNELLLVKHEKCGREYWLLPGGGLEPGETLAQATERELREECGVSIRCGRLLFIAETLEPTKERQIINVVFLAELLAGEPHLATRNDARLIDVGWVTRSRLPELVFFPDFRDELFRQWDSGFSLDAKSLGNLWKD
jgi:ADP-ribose pyrophosphatase YjhB (NUDIX family)